MPTLSNVEVRAARAREQAQWNSRWRPTKITISELEKYWHHDDAGQLDQAGMADPSRADLVAAVDLPMPNVHVLQFARLKPPMVVVP
ncbi:hypothetical protein [Nocardia nova]|uniref:hypothetical protein n=1 Tax=Nocardia nova TaxID=37330 RepID=UPI0033DB4F45